jgi:hypothetical protein
VPHAVVVEPQECQAYAEAIRPPGFLLALPFRDLGQGSIPARNWVWDHAIDSGATRHWILDDNLYGFYRINKGAKIRCRTGSALAIPEKFVERFSNVPKAGLNYQDFLVATETFPPFYLNTRVYSCLLIRNDCRHRWRGKWNEDTDLCLRVLKDGDCTILLNAFAVGKTTTQTMGGGNTGAYEDTDERREFAESLRRQHPDCVKVTRKFNRWHHQVDYSWFRRRNRLKWRAGVRESIIGGDCEYDLVLREGGA